MLHPCRYIASLYLPSHMQPPMCLQYIVMALGAMLSPQHAELAQPFYQRARHYVEVDEMTVSSVCQKAAHPSNPPAVAGQPPPLR